MNILREVRKINQKSMPIRIILLLSFCVMFTITTYAWFYIDNQVKLGEFEGKVVPWELAYYIDENEILDETVTFTLDSLYPGMPLYTSDTVHIYNLCEQKTQIDCEVVSIKLFGEEIYNEDFPIGVSDVGETGKKYTIFSEGTEYPFNISFEHNKNLIEGTYTDDGSEASEKAHATFHMNANWTFQAEPEVEGGEVDDDEILARDDLDTQFGKAAYEFYYPEDGSAEGDQSKALEIQVRILSSLLYIEE